MLRDLPIFPLPIVLFPGAPQPLHIFEPRYQQLLADCRAGDRRFGIAYATPAGAADTDRLPDPGAVGCVALIRSVEPLPDGRSNILAIGEGAAGKPGARPARDERYAQGREQTHDRDHLIALVR